MEKKNLYYLIAVVVIVVVVAFFMMRQPEAPPEVPPAPEPEAEPETVLPEPEVPTEYAGKAEMVTKAVCAEGKIGAVITNVGEDEVTIGKDMKLLLRGMVVKTPGCDKEVLAPGESTTCTQLNGMFPVASGQNEVLVTIGAQTGKATVTCE